jgi:Na+-translocating ferredoxin:NAD+ oxidoreductase RnfE subunit
MLAGFGCSLAFLIYGKTTNEQLLATWGTLFPALAASCVVLGVAWAFAGKGSKE